MSPPPHPLHKTNTRLGSVTYLQSANLSIMHLRIHAALSPQCNAVHLNLIQFCHRSVKICSHCNLHTSSSTCRKQIHLKAKMFKCLKFRVGLRQIRGKLDHNFLSSWSLVVGLIAPIVTNKGEKKNEKRQNSCYSLWWCFCGSCDDR